MAGSYYIIIRGPLGVGKSTISARLAAEIGAVPISIDQILDENDLEEREAGYISQASFRRANEIAAPRALRTLNSGRPVIFDGNFYWRSQIEHLVELLERPHLAFTLKAPVGVCLDREQMRGNPFGPEATKAVFAKSTEFDYGVVVDATRPIEEIVAELVTMVSKSFS